MGGLHARLAPSASHRWLNCPGAPDLEATCPDETSEYADEGTMLHDVMKERLPAVRETRNVDFNDLIGHERKGEIRTFDFTIGHADACRSCAEYAITESFCAPLTVAWIETRVFIPGRKDLYGTADLAILDRPLKRLTVIDWKFGEGIAVYAPNNTQLITYALGFLLWVDGIEEIDRVRIVIHQPRMENHSEWEITADELRAWLPKLLAGAARTDIKPPTYNDGDWCLFCKARAVCPALRATSLAAAASDFDRVADSSDEELARAMSQIPRIEAFVRAIEVETFKRLIRRHSVPGFKLAEGRRSRVYKDELDAGAWALTHLPPGAAFTAPKLVTPKQLEELAKHYGLKLPDLWEWSQGALKVVPQSDERRAMTSAQHDFQPITREDDDDL